MTSLRGTYGELVRTSGRGYKYTISSRRFHTRPRCQAAHNLTMPAMSPTMTEGNISSWKVREGDKFATGDVLLEIETDKAQMDVEAQDEGIMAKIIHADGAKAVKVGSRIAVLAELDDDISNLEIPSHEQSSLSSSSLENTAIEAAPSSTAPSTSESPNHQRPGSAEHQRTSRSSPSLGKKQVYPLYPSVSQLLHENGLSHLDVGKIQASGPQGRLLKGDVLAYIGSIKTSYPAELSARLSKLAQLDLSNVEIATPKTEPKRQAEAPAMQATQEVKTDITVTIDLRSVHEVQERIRKALGIDIPTSIFISRAAEVSNLDLPPSRARQPSSDELFNAVLGLHQIRKTTTGSFTPQLIALPAPETKPYRSQHRRIDIIDALTTKPRKPFSIPASLPSAEKEGSNILSVSVPKAEQHRAKVFLERIKTILHAEPGRCVP